MRRHLASLTAGWCSPRSRWSSLVSLLIGTVDDLAMRDQPDRAARRRRLGRRHQRTAAPVRAPGVRTARRAARATARGGGPAARAPSLAGSPATAAMRRSPTDRLDGAAPVLAEALGAARRTCPSTARCTRSTCPARAPTGWSPTGSTDGVLVVGLPTDDVDDAVASLIGWEVAAGALAMRCWPPAPRCCSYAASCGRCARSPRPRTRSPSCRWPTGDDRPDRAGARAPHRRAHRGRPGRRGAQHAARPRRDVARRAAPQRAAGAAVRRRRLARAAHPAGDDRRLHRAGPPPPRRPRRYRDRAGQGRGGVGAG